jgi:hypothetical protein
MRLRTTLILARRVTLLIALMFWQGGFTFYAAIVVPIGTEVLGSAAEQGFITQRVTDSLNVVTAVALAILIWEMLAGADPARWRRLARWSAVVVIAITLGILLWLHPQLDNLLVPAESRVMERASFRTMHRIYLWTSTVQWAAAVVMVATQPAAWRAEDRSVSAND